MPLLLNADMPTTFWWDTLSNSIAGLAAGGAIAALVGWFGLRVARFSLADDASFEWWRTGSVLVVEVAASLTGAAFVAFSILATLTPEPRMTWADVWAAKDPRSASLFLCLNFGVATLWILAYRALCFLAIWADRTRRGKPMPLSSRRDIPRPVSRRAVLGTFLKDDKRKVLKRTRRALREQARPPE